MLSLRAFGSKLGGRSSALSRLAAGASRPRRLSSQIFEEDEEDQIFVAPPPKPLDLIMEEGVHSLTFAVRGDVIIGVARADAGNPQPPARSTGSSKAWGLNMMTGCLHHSWSVHEEGYVGRECAPQRLEGETDEMLVHMHVDTMSGELRLLHGGANKWADASVRLPSSPLRPWALIPEGYAEDVAPAARLVRHSHVHTLDALRAVDGLDTVVDGLAPLHQARALDWCRKATTYDAAAIGALGLEDEFIAAMQLRHDEATTVRSRLAAL